MRQKLRNLTLLLGFGVPILLALLATQLGFGGLLLPLAALLALGGHAAGALADVRRGAAHGDALLPRLIRPREFTPPGLRPPAIRSNHACSLARSLQGSAAGDGKDKRMRKQVFGLAMAAALALPAKAADITIAVGGAFTSMDPHFFDLSPNHALTWHVFDRLVHPDPDQRPSPGLATSWKPIDELTWEFKLREGVTFHDGTPFTADDVVFTFARAPNVPNSPTSMGQYIRPVTRLEVVDAHTIRLHTAEPVPLIPQMMSSFSIVGRKQGEGPGGVPLGTSDYNNGRAAIGTGPYKLASFTLGDRAVFTKNPAWWGPAQPWDKVTYRMITNDSFPRRRAAIRRRGRDRRGADARRGAAGEGRAAERRPRRPGLRLDLPLCRFQPAADAACHRQGRQPAAEEPADGRAGAPGAEHRDQPRGHPPADHGRLLPAHRPGDAGRRDGLRPVDQGAGLRRRGARKLLAEAGYPDGFAITLHGPNDRYVNDDSIAQAIAQMWTRIGVKTAVATAPASVFFTAGGVRDEHSIALTGWSTSTGEPRHAPVADAVDARPGARPRHAAAALALQQPRARPAGRPRADHDRPGSAGEAVFRGDPLGFEQELAVIPIHHQVNIWAMRKGIGYQPMLSEQTRAMEFSPAK